MPSKTDLSTDRAHIQAAASRSYDLLDGVRSMLGENLTAYVCGADTTSDFLSWLDKPDSTRMMIVRRQLEVIEDVAALFRARNAVTLFRSWLREVSMDLDRASCPAELIRRFPGESARVSLHAAAHRFLEERAPRLSVVAAGR